ncbi:MAG: sodium/proton antiporter NhaB [Gammaproteobacteria bacterium]|nr:sodium/proton antiporter NhaB [Gammaproteobacteria bacterium]
MTTELDRLPQSFLRSTWSNFLGNSPEWYKTVILGFLVVNVLVYYGLGSTLGPKVVGWMLVLEFIFTLAMALKCYPLLPGGLLAIQGVAIGLTSPKTVIHEVELNFEVILLLIFMVAGIYFLKDLLMFIFTKIVIRIRSKTRLSLAFCFMAAILSAFLDALTVTAVVITVAAGFYGVYHRVASGKQFSDDHDHADDQNVCETNETDLEEFRRFLRNLMMHAAVGTALGGVTTTVGEPQNLLISGVVGWEFVPFIIAMAPVTLPVFIVGMMTCVACEKFKILSYGAQLPPRVRAILEQYDDEQTSKRTPKDNVSLIWQGAVVLFLVLALGFHVAAVGLIGLAVIVLSTVFTGVTEEHRIGHAFEEALPFTALLGVFFAIVAVINDQQLFQPVIQWVFQQSEQAQIPLFYIANGVLSMISDNVFVATVYISEVKDAFAAGDITRQQFENLAIAINTGTNIPSVATPNGQAAFLFLLTSALAPLIRLSYTRMLVLALPYTITMSITGLLAVIFILPRFS